MKKLFFFVFLFAIVSATQLNLTMDSLGRWRLPLTARLVETGTDVDARVFLDFHGLHDFLYRPRRNETSVALDIADSLFIGDNTTGRTCIASGNFSIPIVSDLGLWNTMEASIGVGFGSAFGHGFERFIITPSGERGSGLLVLDPSTPEQYAYGGQWFYVNSLCDQTPIIEASVVVGDDTASSPARFYLTSNSYLTLIPAEAFQNIVGYLERAGFNIVDDSTHEDQSGEVPTRVRRVNLGPFVTLYFSRISVSQLAQILPPIHLEIVSGTQRFRITIFPEDYIGATGREYYLSISGVSGHDGAYTLGTNVLRHLAVQIDYENYQIGFAEPLAEF